MKITEYKKDWCTITENNIDFVETDDKFHLIKLNFKDPTSEKIDKVLENFPNTNRFIITDNIRFYNFSLKGVKKYYIENSPFWDLITFFKKNNKVILNLEHLKDFELKFVLHNPNDMLRNLECMMMLQETYQQFKNKLLLDYWTGNVLFLD